MLLRPIEMTKRCNCDIEDDKIYLWLGGSKTIVSEDGDRFHKISHHSPSLQSVSPSLD